MASRKGLVKYGAYVSVWKRGRGDSWHTTEYEISFMLPPEAEHTHAVFDAAQARASKCWKNCQVNETWRY